MKICVVCRDNSAFFYKTPDMLITEIINLIKDKHTDVKKVWSYKGTKRIGDIEIFIGVKKIL